MLNSLKACLTVCGFALFTGELHAQPAPTRIWQSAVCDIGHQGNSMKHQSFVVVRFKDRVLIPTQSMMGGEGGAFLETDPVVVHEISDEQGIVRSIIEAIAKGNPIVPHPSRDAWPKSVLLKPAGVRSQVALERSSATFLAGCSGGKEWHIYPSKRNAKGRWEADMAKIETHPADIPPEQLARRVVELVKNANVQD